MLNMFSDKPFTGKRKQVAELLRDRFGFTEIGMKVETSGNLHWYNIYTSRFGGKKSQTVTVAVKELLEKIDPKYVGCDVWVA